MMSRPASGRSFRLALWTSQSCMQLSTRISSTTRSLDFPTLPAGTRGLSPRVRHPAHLHRRPLIAEAVARAPAGPAPSGVLA
jgi:hypothetical protein